MFDVTTAGTGDPLVLLHGSPVPLSSLDNIIESLRDDYRLVAPHLVDIQMPPQDALAPLTETLREEGAAGAPVIGHSLGSYRALQLAVSDAFPVERVCALSPLAVQPRERVVQYRAIADDIDSIDDAIPVALDMWFSESAASQNNTRQLVHDWLDELGYDALLSALRTELQADDLRSQLPDFTRPVQLIVGEQDAGTPVTWANEIDDLLPHSTLHVLDDTGHFPHVESPDQTLSLIRQFLA